VYLRISRRIYAQLDAAPGRKHHDFGLADPDFLATAAAND
jgi:hypothetical protein